MANLTQIYNRALGLVGAKRVLSPNDDNNRATACNDMYKIARDSTLEARQWSFASKRLILMPEGDSPEFGFQYRFKLPEDTLTVKRACSEADFRANQHWELEDGHILMDSDICYAKLVMRIEDTSKFSGSFTDALCYKLAADICIPLSKNQQLMNSLLMMWEGLTEQAGAQDGTQGKPIKTRPGRLISARFSGATITR